VFCSIYYFLINLRCLLPTYFDHDAFLRHALHVLDAPGCNVTRQRAENNAHLADLIMAGTVSWFVCREKLSSWSAMIPKSRIQSRKLIMWKGLIYQGPVNARRSSSTTLQYEFGLRRQCLPASSLRFLHSSNRHDLFLPRVRTTMAQTRCFASIGPSLWNCLPPPLLRSFIPSALISSCLSLSLVLSLIYFLELKPTESASVWLMPW